MGTLWRWGFTSTRGPRQCGLRRFEVLRRCGVPVEYLERRGEASGGGVPRKFVNANRDDSRAPEASGEEAEPGAEHQEGSGHGGPCRCGLPGVTGDEGEDDERRQREDAADREPDDRGLHPDAAHEPSVAPAEPTCRPPG